MQLRTRIKVNYIQVFSGIDSGPHLPSEILYFVLYIWTLGLRQYVPHCPQSHSSGEHVISDSLSHLSLPRMPKVGQELDMDTF